MASSSEMRIRALTTAIHLLQPQGKPSESPTSHIPYTYRVLSKAYNHLAILLTQGSNGAVAVTGNTDRSAICAVNVQETEDSSRIQSKENADQRPGGEYFVKVQMIEPSTTSLHDLADPSMNSPGQEVALDAHGSDLFKALIDLSNDRRRGTKTEFMRFVWLRCHREMKSRLKADDVMLGTPLHKILQAWCLEDADVVKETHFWVHSNLYPSFDSSQIPFQVVQGTTGREYLFSRSTVLAWSSIFARAFAAVKDLAERCDMELESIDELNKSFFTLHYLLYDNHAFETLLAIRSLCIQVTVAMTITKLDDSDKESDLDALDSDVPLDDDPGKGRGRLVHGCMAMVAWHRAGLSLSRSKIFRERLPQFYMVFAHRSTHNSSMTDLRTLMKEVILPHLKYVSDAAAHVDRLLELDKFATKVLFTGNIHCEATMMALIHSFTSSKRVVPFTHMVTPGLMPFFSNADPVIGVAKKSCLCCYWLGKLLQTDTKESFVLPGTHGIIFPWTPPSAGIPIEVLEGLQEKLVSKLIEITTIWICRQLPRDSSPSLFEDVNMVVPLQPVLSI